MSLPWPHAVTDATRASGCSTHSCHLYRRPHRRAWRSLTRGREQAVVRAWSRHGRKSWGAPPSCAGWPVFRPKCAKRRPMCLLVVQGQSNAGVQAEFKEGRTRRLHSVCRNKRSAAQTWPRRTNIMGMVPEDWVAPTRVGSEGEARGLWWHAWTHLAPSSEISAGMVTDSWLESRSHL